MLLLYVYIELIAHIRLLFFGTDDIGAMYK